MIIRNHLGISINDVNKESPIAGWFIVDNPIEMGDLGF